MHRLSATSLSVALAGTMLVSSTVGAQETVRLFAAASLTDALAEVLSDFDRTHPGSRVVSQVGGSSDLARQILAGAPADLFLSADERQMDRLASEGFIETREDLLSNQLVIVSHRDRSHAVARPEDLLALERVAMADPEAVPAGVYAKRYLEARKLWSPLQDRVVPTLDVRGALAAVASGNIDAGFVYKTDAAMESRVEIAYAVPLEEGPRIVYVLGMIADRQRPDVRRLYDYLQSKNAAAVFQRFGFLVLR